MKIVNSGNFGAEQGALASAFLNNVETGGYAPKGFLTNNGLAPQISALGIQETDFEKIKPAVEKTLHEADASIVFTNGKLSTFEKNVISLIKEYGKKVEMVDINEEFDPYIIVSRFREVCAKTIHVTGASDKKGSKTVYKKVMPFINKFIKSTLFEESMK